MNRRSLVIAAALCLAAGCAPNPSELPTLRFTAIPDHSKSGLQQRFDPLAAHLSQALGIPVAYVPTSDYQGSVEAFKNADVQLAWFGGLTGAQARAAVPGSRAIAQGAIDPHFRSYFIAHPDAGLQRSDTFPQGLKAMSFTFGSVSSTSGRLMPEYFIRQYTGHAPDHFFGSPNHYSGSHDQTARLVESGTIQAGAINYKTYDRMLAEGALDPERCVIIWVTPTYPDYNWSAHPSIDEDFGSGTIARLQAALIALEDPALLRALDRPEGLISATNEDFQPITELAKELGFLR